jgi:hypothetical protein
MARLVGRAELRSLTRGEGDKRVCGSTFGYTAHLAFSEARLLFRSGPDANAGGTNNDECAVQRVIGYFTKQAVKRAE